MSFAPRTLTALRSYLSGQTGLGFASLGIVGNKAHTRGYHLGKDRIYDGSGGPGTGDADYSVKTARDKAGLTDAASAMDIGNFSRLREMSKWLVAEAQVNATGTRDLREIIYSPDGKVVLRWDRERGYASKPESGEADASHLTHTHISYYRDSQSRDKTALFRRFFEPEDTMSLIYSVVGRQSAVAPAGTVIYADATGSLTRGKTGSERRFDLVGKSAKTETDETRFLVDGGDADDPSGLMGWIAKKDLSDWHSIDTDLYNVGVAAAAAAAAKAKR
jgi:hypothetical protein